jgi:hypothetical protein
MIPAGRASTVDAGGRLKPPYWTDADDAELMVLVHEFLGGIFEHNERCSVCTKGEAWCAHVREAFNVVLDWLECRRAASFAAAMRARQNRIDERVSRAPIRKEGQ